MLKILLLAFLLLAVVACKSLSHAPDSQAQMLVANDVTLWPDPAHIPVCWEPTDSGSDSYGAEKGWVKEAIGNSWSQANPKIQFVGWDSCPAQSAGLRIQIDPTIGGHTNGFGAALAGLPHGMQLSLDLPAALLKNDSSSNNVRAKCLVSREATKACVQSIAIHEFGHALGLMHEQNRSDVATGCDKYAPYQALNGVAIGAYDPDSIMNYCANLQNPQQTTLSVGDKQGIIALYSGVKVGVQDPGRPAITLMQDGAGEVPNIVWGHDATINVTYNSNPKFAATSLPDPAVSLKIVGTSVNAAIACGPWVITPISTSIEVRSTQCPYSPTVKGPQSLGELRWNDKFVALLNVDVAAASFLGLEIGSQSGLFDANYLILVAPETEAPLVTVKVATLTTGSAVATTPVNCGAYGSAGSYICTASSLTSQPSGTIIKIDGEMVVAGRVIKFATAYGSVP